MWRSSESARNHPRSAGLFEAIPNGEDFFRVQFNCIAVAGRILGTSDQVHLSVLVKLRDLRLPAGMHMTKLLKVEVVL